MIGAVAGLAVSLLVMQALRPLLASGQSAVDPFAIVAIITALVVTGGLASFGPARLATSVDPAVALRAE